LYTSSIYASSGLKNDIGQMAVLTSDTLIHPLFRSFAPLFRAYRRESFRWLGECCPSGVAGSVVCHV